MRNASKHTKGREEGKLKNGVDGKTETSSTTNTRKEMGIEKCTGKSCEAGNLNNGLADSAVPSDGVTYHPLSGVVREPWCFRDRAFDEWFDENNARVEGVVGDMWEETGAVLRFPASQLFPLHFSIPISFLVFVVLDVSVLFSIHPVFSVFLPLSLLCALVCSSWLVVCGLSGEACSVCVFSMCVCVRCSAG